VAGKRDDDDGKKSTGKRDNDGKTKKPKSKKDEEETGDRQGRKMIIMTKLRN
jgi:hypothetical protein